MNEDHSQSISAQWFRASEETGDFMGIRYGRIPSGSNEVEWSFVSHCHCDGIGGFARLLRENGARLDKLPVTRNSCRKTLGPLWRLWRKKEAESADRRDWLSGNQGKCLPSTDLAWHLFSEEETSTLLAKCREEKVGVNSVLLKHLDQAIRPEIQKRHAAIPWMIPVNLRGDINHEDDTDNHVSFVEPRISPDDSPTEIQQQLQERLKRGDHRANYLILSLGRFLSHQAKVRFITKERAKPAGNIGVFSNLGIWDSEKALNTGDSWLFCPPVVGGQRLGAGAVTFRGRLGLTIQGHPGPVDRAGMAETWMTRWIEKI